MSVLVRRIAGTRDLLALAAASPERYPGLLESVARGNARSRWDILFAFPQASIRLDADRSLCDASGRVVDGGFLDALDAAWRRERLGHDAAIELPFRGGWLVYLGYELAAEVEPGLVLPKSPVPRMPTALAVRCPAAILIDHVSEQTLLMVETGREDLLDELQRDLDSVGATFEEVDAAAAVIEEDPPQRFLEGVARIHAHLLDGDVFQVNLSREWRARLQTPAAPGAVYASLRRANPAPFAGLLQQPGWSVASSSPERLIGIVGDAVQTRPIAGTRARFAGDDEAARLLELVGHPKERAEHVMLIDLERNDLGRICVPGSVVVDEVMGVESYAHVHHLVSNVRGTLRPGTTPGQAIRAVFPGGTITGCPKVRCMQIIAALEGVGRGAYTGALGYLNRDGDLDLNILIRSLVETDGKLRFRAGAGIVADSVAERELDETRAKARGLLRALGCKE